MARKRSHHEAGIGNPGSRQAKKQKGLSASASVNDTRADLRGFQHPLLSLYHRKVFTLREYLLWKLPPSSILRRRNLVKPNVDSGGRDATNAGLQATLDGTFVGILEETKPTVDAVRQRDFQAFTQSQQRASVTQYGSPEDYLQAEVGSTILARRRLLKTHRSLIMLSGLFSIEKLVPTPLPTSFATASYEPVLNSTVDRVVEVQLESLV